MATYEITTDKGTYQIDTEQSQPQTENTPSDSGNMIRNPPTLKEYVNGLTDTSRLASTSILKLLTGQGLQDIALKSQEQNIPDNTTRPFNANVESARNPINQFIKQGTQAYSGTMGSIADTVLSPLGLLTGGESSILSKSFDTSKSISMDILKSVQNPQKYLDQAQKLTTEVLDPLKSELSNANYRGKILPAVQEATKVIQKSNNYQELNANLKSSINDIFTQRNEILKNNNFDIKPDYMNNLSKLIEDTKNGGQATPPEIQQMEDVLTREKAWYVYNGNKLDRLGGQARKELLQNQTENLLTKLESGDTIITQPARKQALDALRSGLKTAVEGGDQQVAALNATYNGLKRARELVSGQQALEQKALQQSRLQTAIDSIRNPLGVPSILKKAREVGSKTGKIEDLIKKAKNAGLQIP